MHECFALMDPPPKKRQTERMKKKWNLGQVNELLSAQSINAFNALGIIVYVKMWQV